MADVMPVRTSTNPVLGINRCECGGIRTIHRPKGKRSKYLYSLCDDCGSNQQTGKYWQGKFNLHYPTIEALHEAEQPEPVTEPEQPTDEQNSKAEESQAGEAPKALPAAGGESSHREAKTPAAVGPTSRTQVKPPQAKETELKPFWPIFRGVVLGALCGGVIARF